MLGFQRSKRVGIWTEGHHRLVAHGILEDDIYGLEVRMVVDPTTREIRSVKGWWNRWTTPDCPLAVERIQDAVGVSIDDPDLARRLQRTVGRKGCRHFANIVIECCHTAREAIDVLRYEAARAASPGLPFRDFADPAEAAPPPAQRSLEAEAPPPEPLGPEAAGEPRLRAEDLSGPFIDLHVHTAPASPCSSAPVDDLIREAARIGLEGICLTDHNHVWSPEDVEELRQKHGFLVLRGNEIITDQGDVVVFGLERDVQGITRLEELREEVVRAGGFMIAAHPFRGFLTFGVDKLGLTPEKALKRKVFQYVDGVEILNGKVNEEENRFAGEVARGLGRVLTGGSDAHEVEEVGLYATRFDSPVRNEQELIEALKTGRTAPVAFRAMNRADMEARP
jgi:predicted metal-dependent phosphoesterase TrpH